MDQLVPTENVLALPLLLRRGVGAFPRRHAADAHRRGGRRAAVRSTTRSTSTRSAASTCRCRGCCRPMSRRRQLLFNQRKRFFSAGEAVKTPFIIGMAGSVAVGKSTTARVLKELLARWPSSPKVDLVTTDGFLYPNAVLRQRKLMERKGFPESYDVGALLRFLSAIKSGQRDVARAGLFAPDLRCCARRVRHHRPARHPDLRRAQRAADRANCRRTARPCRSCPTSSTSRSISMPRKARSISGTSPAS